MNKLFFLTTFWTVAILGICACKKDKTFPVDAKLVLSPQQIKINDNEEAKLSLSIQPRFKVEWKVTSKPEWLEVSPLSGIYENTIQEIVLQPRKNLKAGKYTGIIELISNGAGNGAVQVELMVGARPKAQISLQRLDFPDSIITRAFTIKNTGTGFLSMVISADSPWINIFPSIVNNLNERDSVLILVGVAKVSLPPGNLQASLLVKTNAIENTDIKLPVSAVIPEIIKTQLDQDSLLFDYFTDTRPFTLRNYGNTTYNWTAESTQPFFKADPAGGSVEPGKSVQGVIRTTRGALPTGTYQGSIVFKNDKNNRNVLPAILQHFRDDKLSINGQVIDAEYDRANDKLIIATENPNQLLILNPVNRLTQIVPLSIRPNCISVSQDGLFAVIGYRGSFSYVNLTTAKIEKNYDTTADVLDILLSSNKWVYIFPQREETLTTIRCINLETGLESPHQGEKIYTGTVGKLHPDGKTLYAATNSVTPSEVIRFDISEGIAKYMYDSPYHDNYYYGGQLWIPDNGDQIFTRYGHVLRTSNRPIADLIYSGKLNGVNQIASVDYFAKSGKIYVINTGFDLIQSEIRRYESPSFTFKGTTALPSFLWRDWRGNGRLNPSTGYFGFFNSKGDKFYVLVRAGGGSGLSNDWAFSAVEVE